MRTLEEMQFWQDICQTTLKEELMITRHEDREITPGVPDLHYVPKGEGEYRVGWIELKAKKELVTPSNRVTVEPSQHQYFRRWAPHMPIHFMVRVKGVIYVIPGKFHRELMVANCVTDLVGLSDIYFPHRQLVEKLVPFLKTVTKI